MAKKELPDGVITALITPRNEDGEPDLDGLRKNIQFQIDQGVSGVLPMGTTGETPTVTEDQHDEVIGVTAEEVDDLIYVLAGCGSNNTDEALHCLETAMDAGCDGALFNDPYYNGPSSLEIRKEYYQPIAQYAAQYAEQNGEDCIDIVPYIIPGRTGCEISVADLVILRTLFPHVAAVKEASGNPERMRLYRKILDNADRKHKSQGKLYFPGAGFKIFSGDDDMTTMMMTDLDILASGVISVISNFAPGAIQQMCMAILNGELKKARELRNKLAPLFSLVTVKAQRIVTFGNEEEEKVTDKFRNPLPVKTIMNALGMPAGPCKAPLGKMSFEGMNIVREALRQVWNDSPEILEPTQEFYNVNLEERINKDSIWGDLFYSVLY